VETLAFQHIFPPQVHVLKRELLWIPFFGWGLALMSRSRSTAGAGTRRCASWRKRGRQRLEPGLLGGGVSRKARALRPARAATTRSAAPGSPRLRRAVVPVAHNAGRCWPRNAFFKRPGTVTVRIGRRSSPAAASRRKSNQLAREWIEEQQKALA